MAEIINLSTNIKETSPELKHPLSVQLLNEFNKNPDSFQELIIFFKKPNGDVGVIDTMPSIEDKCLFLQMLQHQVVCHLDRYRTTVSPDMIINPPVPELEEDK